MTVSILVVDDEIDVTELFSRRFRREIRDRRYALQFAHSGQQALSLIDAGVVPELGLVLSDINMPGMNGFELLREVKQSWPELPVMMISAYGDWQNRERAADAGADEFFSKPIDFSALKQTLADCLA